MKLDKKLLAEILVKLGLIPADFTGELTIGLNSGGVSFVRKSETLK